MNHIQDFLSTFKNGFQRANRYVCQIIVTPDLVTNIIADSLSGDAGLIGTITRIASAENAVLAVPQVVKWLAQGYLVDTARLPSRGFGTTELSMYGITEYFPYHSEYATFDCTFLMPYATNVSNDGAIPRFFSYWQNQIQHASRGPETGFDFAFPSSYYATVLLTALDRKNRGTLTYKFDKVYPVTVDSVPLSWAENDQFTKLPVSFRFSYWTILPVAESLALSFIDQALL